MKLSAIKRISREDLPGAEQWVEQLLQPLNSFMEQSLGAMNGNLSVGDNQLAAIRTYRMTHGTQLNVQNPLKTKPVGVYAVYSDTFPVTALTMTYRQDGSIGLTARYDSTNTVIGPISRLRSAATGLSTGAAKNVCSTTSITLTPGDWDVRGAVGFTPGGATNATALDASVSKTSATLSAADTLAVPTAGELRFEQPGYIAPGSGYDAVVVLPNYTAAVATGATLALFLVAYATFTVSTLSAYGYLEARRIGPASGAFSNVSVLFIGG